MQQRLSVPDIASIIGVEEDIITSALAREDEDLKPYLYSEPVITSGGTTRSKHYLAERKRRPKNPKLCSC